MPGCKFFVATVCMNIPLISLINNTLHYNYKNLHINCQ
nr:MAG TPA: hypothetical protein [Caudoviricetes sp.]